MYKITIPEDIKIITIDKDNKQKELDVAFKNYLINNPLNNQAFGSSYDELVDLSALIERVKAVSPGDTIELTDTQYERIARLTLEPQEPYLPEIGIQILPFLKAIKEAKQ